MSQMDLSHYSVAELKQALTEIPQEIIRRQKTERMSLLKELQVRALAAGFTLDDLIKNTEKKVRPPVPVKFRHPQNNELVWSGRGRKPQWVLSYLAQGGNLDQLAI